MDERERQDQHIGSLGEHLRLVQMVLCVITITLIVSVQGARFIDEQADFTTALNITNALQTNSDRSPLELIIRERLSLHTRPEGDRRSITMTNYPGRPSLQLGLEAIPAAFVFHDASFGQNYATAADGYTDFYFGAARYHRLARERSADRRVDDPWSPFQKRPTTVREFKLFWNAAGLMRRAYTRMSTGNVTVYRVASTQEPGAIATLDRSSPFRHSTRLSASARFLVPVASSETKSQRPDRDLIPATIVELTDLDDWNADGFDEVSRQLQTIARWDGKQYVWISSESEALPDDLVAVASAAYRPFALALQDHFLELAQDPRRRRGSFEQSFSYLTGFLAELKYQGDVDVQMLQAFLQKEVREGGAPVDIAGLTIERAVLNQWGLTILFAVQIYFLLNLREFKRALTALPRQARVRSPWLGVFPGAASDVALFLSAIALPIVGAVYVCLWRFEWSRESAVIIMLLVGVLAAASLTVPPLLAIRRLVRTATP